MKFIVSSLFVLVLFVSNTINAQKKVTITATVENVTSNKGKVGFILYNKTTFMKQPLQSIDAEIIEGKSVAVFKNIEAGDYAIVCLHDKNENGRMDFSAEGRPLEDYGTSNNVMSFGPPNYEDSKFTVKDKNVKLNIRF